MFPFINCCILSCSSSGSICEGIIRAMLPAWDLALTSETGGEAPGGRLGISSVSPLYSKTVISNWHCVWLHKI